MGLAKADALRVFADHIERVYGEHGECSEHMHQRTIDVILDIAREHLCDLEDYATDTNLDDAGVLQNAKLYYGDDTNATPASEQDDATTSEAGDDTNKRYDVSVVRERVGKFNWWFFAFTSDGKHVVEAGMDVCATSEQDATCIAIEHVHGKLAALHELAMEETSYYAHQLRQLNALARYGARFNFTGESVVSLD